MIKKLVAKIFRFLILICILLIALFEISIFINTPTIKIENKKTECYNNCNLEFMSLNSIVNIYNQKEYQKFLGSAKETKQEKQDIDIQEAPVEEAPNEEANVSTYEATFYTAKCKGCTGVTSSGYNVTKTIFYKGYRIVAAPSNIKFYTKLKITLNDGTVMDAIVLDRGGSIKNNRLDILVSSKDEAYKLGRQQVQVEVVK